VGQSFSAVGITQPRLIGLRSCVGPRASRLRGSRRKVQA
jgi:hypothetical protein